MDQFSEGISVLLITLITLSEKVAGGVFECSRAQVEADWLVSVSMRSVQGRRISMLSSPVFWMSASELLNNLASNLIKLCVSEADFSKHSVHIIFALLFFVCCAICLQLYMIQGIRHSKLD
jgi:hypothetical protein